MARKASTAKTRHLGTCIIPGCGGPVQARGLCHTCYLKARDRINKKPSIEKTMVAQGLLLASRRGKRPELPPFERMEAALAGSK